MNESGRKFSSERPPHCDAGSLNRILLALFTLFSLIFSNAWAQKNTPQAVKETCSDKDFSATLGEVRDQADIGWCFANAAADLITYKFRHIWPAGAQASAIWIALRNNIKSIEPKRGQPGTYVFDDSGGDIGAAIRYAAEDGFSCPRNLDIQLIKGGMGIGLKKKLYSLEYIQKLFRNAQIGTQVDQNIYRDYIRVRINQGSILSLISDNELSAALALPTDKAAIAIARSLCEPYKHNFPTNMDTASRVARFYNEEHDFYDDVQKKNIYKKFPDFMALINKQIDEENVVGIGYNFDLIKVGHSNLSGDHAGVLVGRKKVNGQCLYKIRNSWGPGCFKQVENRSMPIYGGKVVRCEESGHVWVKGEDLLKHLVSVTYIRN